MRASILDLSFDLQDLKLSIVQFTTEMHAVQQIKSFSLCLYQMLEWGGGGGGGGRRERNDRGVIVGARLAALGISEMAGIFHIKQFAEKHLSMSDLEFLKEMGLEQRKTTPGFTPVRHQQAPDPYGRHGLIEKVRPARK